MKILIILFTLTCVCSNSIAQTYKVQWGDEMKVKKGSMDMEIVHADKSGVYMIEGRIKMKSYFVVGYSVTETFKLYKFDPNYNVVYDREYKKELKGLTFNSIQPLLGQLYLFGHDYKKKEKEYIIYGAKINNNTGSLEGEMQELCSFQLDSRKDDLDFVIRPTDDSTRWIIVGDITNDVTSGISVFLFDKNLNKKGSARINFGFAPGTFDLESITQVADNKLLLMGRQYEVIETGKKKRRVRTFKKYVLTRYSSTGKKEAEINMDVGERYTISGQLIPQKNGEVYLAGFYSNAAKRGQINGVMLYKIDVANGVLLQSAFQDVNSDMLSKPISDDADNDEETRSAKHDMKKAELEGDADGFSSTFVIRNIIKDPETNSLLIIAESYSYRQYSYTTSSYNSLRKTWDHRTRTVFSFTNNDILVINTDLEKNRIKQVNIIPKSQAEHISDYSGPQNLPNNSSTVHIVSFYARGGGMPFYSSFTSLIAKDKLVFLFNDHSNNANVKATTDKVKTITNFKKSVAYGMSLDLSTGEINRKIILSNTEEPVLMPRFGFVVGNDVYMPAMKMKIMGKTEMKMGKITVR